MCAGSHLGVAGKYGGEASAAINWWVGQAVCAGSHLGVAGKYGGEASAAIKWWVG